MENDGGVFIQLILCILYIHVEIRIFWFRLCRVRQGLGIGTIKNRLKKAGTPVPINDVRRRTMPHTSRVLDKHPAFVSREDNMHLGGATPPPRTFAIYATNRFDNHGNTQL